jgi:transcriptional regulator with XRE-family HTH domain
MELGEMVRQSRIKRGLSQRQLGDRCGLDNTTISKIEVGTTKYPPRVETLETIAFALDLNVDELIAASGRVDQDLLEMLGELMKQAPSKTRAGIEALVDKPELLDLVLENWQA